MKYTFLVLLIFLMACKNDKSSNPENNTLDKTATIELSNNSNALPRIPLENLKEIFDKCDQIDYIFHNLNFSLSLTQGNSVKKNVLYAADRDLGSFPADCKPIGRKVFYGNGEYLAEADLYFFEPCYHLVWIEKEKPIFANALTEDGIKFYSNIFSQAGVPTK